MSPVGVIVSTTSAFRQSTGMTAESVRPFLFNVAFRFCQLLFNAGFQVGE